MRAFPTICALGLSLIASATLHSQLVFEQDRVTHTAVPGEESFRGEFPFVNRGDSTVTIGSIRSTCGCTVPELDKTVYEPGESGVISAVFTYGQRTGRQQKTITVPTTFDTHHLYLSVDIPLKWTVEPRIQTWRIKGELETKTISIRFESISPTDVRLTDYPEDRFRAEPRWNPEDKTFAIDFTPLDLDTNGVLRAHVQVQTDGTSSDIPLYLRIY